MARYNLGPCQGCCSDDELCNEVRCPSGYVCIGGLCIRACRPTEDSPVSGCSDSSDCPDGCVCVNGVCVSSGELGSCCEIVPPFAGDNERNCYVRRPYTIGDQPTCVMLESLCVDDDEEGITRSWRPLNERSCNQCPATREGACCLPDGACEVLCETECNAIDGAVYKGDLWLDCDTPRFPGYSGGACDPDEINCFECCHSYSADFTNPPTCPDGWTLELGDDDGDGVADNPSWCSKCDQLALNADNDAECAQGETDAIQEMVAHINASPNRTQIVNDNDVLASGATNLTAVGFECPDGKCYEGVDELADCPGNPLP
jgi:hypothetical protein